MQRGGRGSKNKEKTKTSLEWVKPLHILKNAEENGNCRTEETERKKRVKLKRKNYLRV